MRKVLTTVLLGLSIATIAIAGGGCNSSAGVTQTTTATPTKPTSGFYDVNVQESYSIIQANKNNTNFVIIDVRTPEEYAAGHIDNATLIDFYAENFKTEIGKLDRAKTYFLYCRSGNRSGQAQDIMKEMGFISVYNMTGGITDWQAAGYGVVK
jgi:rhodanese-related sulfurtransferase